MDFGRVVTAMVTPFDAEQQVNWTRTEELIDYLIEEQRTDSIVVSGTTGESPTLIDEEKLKLFETAVKRAAGRCKIIAGTGSNGTEHSIHLTQEAEKLGVDGMLLVAPYYNRPTQEGLYQHFKSIAEHTSLPVMLYNVPKRTAVNIAAETTIRLAQELPNVVATKEATNDFAQITKIITNTPENFRLYSGDDEITLPILSVGGYGVVSVASHIRGKEVRAVVEAYVNGDVKQAAKLHGELMPLFKALFLYPNPVPVKYALSLRNMDVGGVRLPLANLQEDEKTALKPLFE